MGANSNIHVVPVLPLSAILYQKHTELGKKSKFYACIKFHFSWSDYLRREQVSTRVQDVWQSVLLPNSYCTTLGYLREAALLKCLHRETYVASYPQADLIFSTSVFLKVGGFKTSRFEVSVYTQLNFEACTGMSATTKFCWTYQHSKLPYSDK